MAKLTARTLPLTMADWRKGLGITALPPRFKRCDPSCQGWGHFSAGHGDEIQRCDDCARFEDDDQAVEAHRLECGCEWPERAPRHDMGCEDFDCEGCEVGNG